MPKAAASVAIALFALLSFFSNRVPLALIAALVVGGLLVEWLLAKVELVQEPAPAA